MQVVYELVFVDGKAQCRNVRPGGPGPTVPMAPMGPPKGPQGKAAQWSPSAGKGGKGAPQPSSVPVGESLTGTVKTWKPGTFGFITCEELAGDVWFGTRSLVPGVPEPQVGDTVSFVLMTKPTADTRRRMPAQR